MTVIMNRLVHVAPLALLLFLAAQLIRTETVTRVHLFLNNGTYANIRVKVPENVVVSTFYVYNGGSENWTLTAFQR